MPVLTVLSHSRGQVNVEVHEEEEFHLLADGKPDEHGIFVPDIPIGRVDSACYWPEHFGPTTVIRSAVYQPIPTPLVIEEVKDVPAGTEVHPVHWVSPAQEQALGLPPTSHYSASGWIQQLDHLLDLRDGEAAGPQGHHEEVKAELITKLPGLFSLPSRN